MPTKEIIIQLTGQTLIFYEPELIRILPEDLHRKAIARGKRYLRANKTRGIKTKKDELTREYSTMFRKW